MQNPDERLLFDYSVTREPFTQWGRETNILDYVHVERMERKGAVHRFYME